MKIRPRQRCLGRWPALLAALGLLVSLPAVADTVQYTYDTAERLTSVDYGAGRKLYYIYDAAGNISARKFIVITDADHDGMDDQWELDNLETMARDGTGDLDADGLSDAGEYRAGTDPKDPASTLKVLHVEHSTELPVTESLAVSNDVARVSWNTVPGESYKVQFKDSLDQTNWADLAPELIAPGTIGLEMDTGSNPQRFYRVMRTGASPASYTTVSWTSVPGKTYRVQFKQSLSDPFWTDLAGDVTAVLGIASRSDVTADSASRYYRVMVLP